MRAAPLSRHTHRRRPWHGRVKVEGGREDTQLREELPASVVERVVPEAEGRLDDGSGVVWVWNGIVDVPKVVEASFL